MNGIFVVAATFALAQGPTAPAEQPRAVCIEVNDVAGLQRAAAGLSGAAGGLIRLRPGNYELDQPIRLTGVNCVTIEGGGWNTVLVRRGGGNSLEVTDSGFCVVRDLLLTCADHDDKGSGIVFRGSSSSNTVSMCRIVGFPECGIRYEGERGRPMSSNSVRDCHFIGNRGVQLHSLDNNDFYIVGNQFGAHGESPRTGCHLERSSAGTYMMNYHWDNEVALVLGPGSHFNRIADNRFEESRREGVRIGAPGDAEACRLNILTGNTFHTNGKGTVGAYPAVCGYRAEDIVFSANQVFSWNSDQTRHTSAVALDENCRTWIITDNTFRHHTDAALKLAGQGHVVRDNVGAE